MNNKNKKSKLNVKKIVSNKGVYITLATLIVVFGTAAVVKKLTSGVVVSKSNFDTVAVDSPYQSSDDSGDDEIFYDRSLGEIYYEPDEITDTPVPETVPVMSDTPFSQKDLVSSLDISLPVNGEIIRKHSPSEHVYYKSMDDWRTHNGIDISAPIGSVVCACSQGIVEKVYEDKKLGVVVEIGHENNVKSRYANLQDLNFIEVGRKVQKGDVIGSVGESSVSEGHDDPHVHFEIVRDGESKNPLEYTSL